MPRCFVIQPFDRGPHDKRYDDVVKPAIHAAGLEPYRVDQDPGVVIPIDSIHEEIRTSDVCVADISTNNPNVWYELGYALALGKAVILICSDQRGERFPFDIQHRHIIRYTTEAPSDFAKLETDITERLRAQVEKQSTVEALASRLPLTTTGGLPSHEIAALAVMMAGTAADASGGGHGFVGEMESAGFTRLAASLAVTALLQRGFVEKREDFDNFGNPYPVYSVSSEGKQWLLDNQDKLQLRARGSPVNRELRELEPDDVPY